MARWLKKGRSLRLAAVLASAVAIVVCLDSRTAGPSFDSRRIFESVYRVQNESGVTIGTAFAVHGGFLTAWHVGDGEKKLWLVSASGKRFGITGARGNKTFDVALLLADVKGPELEIEDEAFMYRGMRAWAVGHTFGLPYMVSDGVVSMIGYFPPGTGAERWVVVVTAWVGGGNSGGPVVDDRGKVVGMVQSFIAGKMGQTHMTMCAAPSELKRVLGEFPVP